MLTIHNNRSVFRPKQGNVKNKKKRSKAESMFELSCQQSKNWLLLKAFVSLGEAAKCFVVFKFYWFSLDLLFLLGQAKRYVKKHF